MSDSRRGRNVGSEAGVGSAPEGEGEAATDDGQPRVVGVDSDDAEELIGALSSETSRNILSELSDESSTASEVADSLGMTVQNARYHLEKLEEAGLIQVDETRYSPKGREMNVYAPTDGPQVVFVGGEEDTADIRDALLRFLGGLTVVAFASLVVQNVSRVLGDSFFGMGSSGGGGGGAGSGGSQGDGSAVAPVYQGENATVSSGREGDSDAGMESFDATKSLNDSTSEKIRSSLNASAENLSGRMEELYRANRRLQEKVRVLKEQNKELQTSIDAGAEATRAAEPAAHLPPGLLFFAGGFLVLVLGAGWWYWRNGR